MSGAGSPRRPIIPRHTTKRRSRHGPDGREVKLTDELEGLTTFERRTGEDAGEPKPLDQVLAEHEQWARRVLERETGSAEMPRRPIGHVHEGEALAVEDLRAFEDAPHTQKWFAGRVLQHVQNIRAELVWVGCEPIPDLAPDRMLRSRVQAAENAARDAILMRDAVHMAEFKRVDERDVLERRQRFPTLRKRASKGGMANANQTKAQREAFEQQARAYWVQHPNESAAGVARVLSRQRGVTHKPGSIRNIISHLKP